MKTKIIIMECPDCSQDAEFTSYLHKDGKYYTETDATCKQCCDGFWEAMGEDPCGKDWG